MSIIRSGTTSTTKLSIESDDTDVILFKSANINLFQIDNAKVAFSSNSLVVPSGNTLQRPSGAIPGEIRYNIETGFIETYNSSGSWV